jgi:hypothetical protein
MPHIGFGSGTGEPVARTDRSRRWREVLASVSGSIDGPALKRFVREWADRMGPDEAGPLVEHMLEVLDQLGYRTSPAPPAL